MGDTKNINISCRLPEWNELPDLDLYMDQVIALMSKYIPGLAEDKLLTSSMINNYVKTGAMPPPVKKRYSRSHIVHLIIICVLKQIMPISSIKKLIDSMLQTCSEQELMDNFSSLYSQIFGELSSQALSSQQNSTAQAAINCAVRSYILKSCCEYLLKSSVDAPETQE